jgi:hypothetical protein
MLRKRYGQFSLKTLKGQTYLEYAIVVSAVAFLLFAMTPLIKRGIQSLTLTVADQIGNQGNSDQRFDPASGAPSRSQSLLQISNVITRTNVQKTEAGYGTYVYNDAVATDSETTVSLGVTSNVVP